MTPEDRRGRGTELCKVLAGHVADIAPNGIGVLDRTWDVVAPADAEFMLVLIGWEATGGEADQAKVRAAFDRVLDAWRRASTLYEQRTSESTS